MKVVIAEPVKEELAELILRNNKDWVVYEDYPKNKEEFIERVKDADVACSYFSRFDEDVLSNSPNLKYLAIAAVGAEYSVDMEYAKRTNVTVMNCPGYNSVAVAEMAVGLAIDVCRSISFLSLRMSQGVWANGEQLNKVQISGKKITLVGYGNIGKAIHGLLKNWCQEFTVINSRSSDDDLSNALAEGDIVFVCCALNSSTEGLITKQKLSNMKDTAILVNVARGAIVDEDALYEVLKSKGIAGAGLDVFSDEPTQGEALPVAVARFAALDTVVCSPHTGAGTKESGVELSQMVYDNIISALEGRPTNIYK